MRLSYRDCGRRRDHAPRAETGVDAAGPQGAAIVGHNVSIEDYQRGWTGEPMDDREFIQG